MEERTIFPLIFGSNRSEVLPHRVSFPVGESSPHGNCSAPRLPFSFPVGSINYSFLGGEEGELKTCCISQQAYPRTTLQVCYLRIFVILDTYYHQVCTIPVLPRNSLGGHISLYNCCCSDKHLLHKRGKRKSLSSCRHKQLPSTRTTQNATVLRLHLSSSLQQCSHRSFAQGYSGLCQSSSFSRDCHLGPMPWSEPFMPMPPHPLLPDLNLIPKTEASIQLNVPSGQSNTSLEDMSGKMPLILNSKTNKQK